MKAKLFKEKENHYTLLMENINDLSGIIASSVFENEYTSGKLSTKNCQAIERGYDLDEMSEKEFPLLDESWCRTGAVHEENLQLLGHRNSFRKGFQKAVEILGDKKFSEEDIDKAFNIGVEMLDSPRRYNDVLQELKKSLQQTEWEVEIEMENYEPLYGMGSTPRPKLDANGCLILKKKVK